MTQASPLAGADLDTFLNITRTFAAPREKVYAAWTEPEHLKQWWGPEGVTAPVVEIDLREYGDRDATRAAIRDPKDVPCDTVGNPADPDASYNAHKGQGYMAQIVETYCEDVSNEAVAATPDLITHVEVHKMTVHDGHRLADALDDLSGLPPISGPALKLEFGAG